MCHNCVVADVETPVKKGVMATETSRQATIKQKIVDLIESGRWRAGERIPPVRRFAADFDVCPSIAARAISDLAAEGLVVTRRGAGTFVSGEATARDKAVMKLGYGMVATRELDVEVSGSVESIRKGIEDATGTHMIHLLSVSVGTDDAHIEGLLSRLRREDTRYGFALVSVPIQVKQFFQRHKIPAVVLGSREPGITLPAIGTDAEQVVRDAMNILLEAGHERIALVSRLPYRGGDHIVPEVYRQVLRERGLCDGPGCEERVIAEVEDEHAIKRSVARRLKGTSAPTAFVAEGGLVSFWTLQVVRELGLRVPEDVALVSMADSVLCRHYHPAITAIHFSYDQLGRLAGDVLARMLANAFVPSQQITLPHRCVLRATTAGRADESRELEEVHDDQRVEAV